MLISFKRIVAPRRNASTIAEKRAALPNTPADWIAFVGKRINELPDSGEAAAKRKGLQELQDFIKANPDFIAERSEEMKKFVVPSWDDRMSCLFLCIGF